MAATAPTRGTKMKAIVRHKYGSPDVLALEDVDAPALEDDRALVRVHAASVNALDWHLLRGLPYLVRLSEGLRRPKRSSMGVDVAGRVEAVGKKIHVAVSPGGHHPLKILFPVLGRDKSEQEHRFRLSISKAFENVGVFLE